jgi:hypothetical protein
MYTFVESRIQNPEDHEPAIWLLPDPQANPETRKNLIPNVASFILAAAQVEERAPASVAAMLSTLEDRYIAGAVREDFMEIFESNDQLNKLRFERIKTITQAAMQGPLVDATLAELNRLRTVSGDHFAWANHKGYNCVVEGARLVPYILDLEEQDRQRLGNPKLDPRIDTHVLGHKLVWSGDNMPPTQPKYGYETVLGQFDSASKTFHEIQRSDIVIL